MNVDEDPDQTLVSSPNGYASMSVYLMLLHIHDEYQNLIPGLLAQSVTYCADPGVASLIPAQSHTFGEIDHEIISTVILLLIQEGFLSVNLQDKVCAQSTG